MTESMQLKNKESLTTRLNKESLARLYKNVQAKKAVGLSRLDKNAQVKKAVSLSRLDKNVLPKKAV